MESKISFWILVVVALAVTVCAQRRGGPRSGEWGRRPNSQQDGRGRFGNRQDAAWPQNPEARPDFDGPWGNGPRPGGGPFGGRRFDGPWFEAPGQGNPEGQNEMTGQGFRQNPEARPDFGGPRGNGPRPGGGPFGGRRFDGPWFQAPGQGNPEGQNEMTGQGFRRGGAGRPFFGQGGRRDGQGPEGDMEVQPISDGAGWRFPPRPRPHPHPHPHHRHHHHHGPHNETENGEGSSEEEAFGRRNDSHEEGYRHHHHHHHGHRPWNKTENDEDQPEIQPFRSPFGRRPWGPFGSHGKHDEGRGPRRGCRNKTDEDRPGRGPFGWHGHHFGRRNMTDNDRPGRGDMDYRPPFRGPGRFDRPFGRPDGRFDRPFRGRGRDESEEEPTIETATDEVTTSEPEIVGIERNDVGNEVNDNAFMP